MKFSIRPASGVVRGMRWSGGLMLVLAATATTANASAAVIPVPELDPGSMVGAAALLSGGAVLLMNRLQRRK